MKTTLLVSLATLVASTPAVAQPAPATQFATRILAAHNVLRVQARVPQIVWDNSLATGAAVWAQYLARTGLFQHSDRNARRGIGENLWYGAHGRFSPEAMVGLWGAERRNFVPGIFPNTSRTGNWYDASHYTQVIWPVTQRVGCAVASNGRNDYLVCRYAPAGNIDGRRVP